MLKRWISLPVGLGLLIASIAVAAPPAQKPGRWMKRAEAGKPIYASFVTRKGTIVVKLYSKRTPRTVENFVGLASGEKAWKNPTGAWVHKPLYDGTIFHRTIKGFMIQGGDPTGTGMFSPGFHIDDEVRPDLTFDHQKGLLAMANAGPNTNGSQFFITVSTPKYLDGHYSIFGEVVSGYPVAVAISEQPVHGDRPIHPVKIEKVTLSTHPPRTAKIERSTHHAHARHTKHVHSNAK